MQNPSKQEKILNLRKHCNKLAQSFTNLSLKLVEIAREIDYESSTRQPLPIAGIFSDQIAFVAKVKSEFEENSLATNSTLANQLKKNHSSSKLKKNKININVDHPFVIGE